MATHHETIAHNRPVFEILVQVRAGSPADGGAARRSASSQGSGTVPSLACGSIGAEWDTVGCIPTVIQIVPSGAIVPMDEGATHPSPWW